MNRTFYTMKQNVGKLIGDTSTDMLSMIGTFLNDRLNEVLQRTNLLDTNRQDYSLTTVAGTEDYILPQDFSKELSVIDKTNKRPLQRIDSQINANTNYSVLDTQGEVISYIILDKTVRKQPTAASVLAITSASTADTTQTVYIKGYDTNGYEVYESVTLTGTTAANSTKTYLTVANISKSAATAGAVTVTSNSSAVTVAILSMEQLEHRCKVMRLVQVPGSAISIEINYIQKMLPMTQNYDYPIIPCEDILEAGAIADAWRFKRQFAKAADFDIVFEKRLANMIYNNEAQPNKLNLFRPITYRSADSYGGNVDDCRRYGIF